MSNRLAVMITAAPLIVISTLTMAASCEHPIITNSTQEIVQQESGKNDVKTISNLLMQRATMMAKPFDNDKHGKLISYYNQSMEQGKTFSEYYRDQDEQTRASIDRAVSVTGLDNLYSRGKMGDDFYNVVASDLRTRALASGVADKTHVIVDKRKIGVDGDTAVAQPGAVTVQYTMNNTDTDTPTSTNQEPINLIKVGGFWYVDVDTEATSNLEKQSIDNGFRQPITIADSGK